MPKSPKKETQGTAASAKKFVATGSKNAEEMDEDDKCDPKPPLFISDGPVLTDFQASYPEDFKVIHQLFTGPSAIKTAIGAIQGYDGQDDFRTKLYANTYMCRPGQ